MVDQPDSDAEPGTTGLKSRLVHVATELLVTPRDVKLPTMREIATAAGVAPGAAYRHFASQDELFLAVVTHLFDDLESSLAEAAKNSTDPRSELRNLAQGFVAWGINNPGGYQLLFETTDDDRLLSAGHRPGLHLIEQLATLLSLGAMPAPEQRQLATQLWVSMHGLVSLRIHKRGMPWPTNVEQDVDLLLQALLKP